MSTETKRVAVFTGTRAEYGLLAPVLRLLEQSDDIELSLIVAGAHLSLLHGMTIDAIVADGFQVDARVEMLLASDSPTAATKSVGLTIIDLATHLDRLRPDLLVVLGDRYEVLAAVTAATIMGIPVAHIHGGELTEGAFDDSIRHAITKMSHLHFVATPEFGRRVAQMGEDSERIHVVGAPALDTIRTLSPVSVAELSRHVGLELSSPVIVVAYHPSTIPGEDPAAAVRTLLGAVDKIDDATVVCSLPNADPRFDSVREILLDYAADRATATAVTSIGHERYLSLLRHAAVLIGNSSAGIIEAPVLGTPVVNVGQRQKGRPASDSVISVAIEPGEIDSALQLALSPEFRARVRDAKSPYDLGVSVASAIVAVIEQTDLPALLKKRFVDRGGDT